MPASESETWHSQSVHSRADTSGVVALFPTAPTHHHSVLLEYLAQRQLCDCFSEAIETAVEQYHNLYCTCRLWGEGLFACMAVCTLPTVWLLERNYRSSLMCTRVGDIYTLFSQWWWIAPPENIMGFPLIFGAW